jgi:hypothetical protein
MDGLKIPIQCYGDYKTQNVYYNGWLHAHLVGCVFAFAPSSVIIAMSVTCHDSFIAENGGLYEKLNAIFHSIGGKCGRFCLFCSTRCILGEVIENPYDKLDKCTNSGKFASNITMSNSRIGYESTTRFISLVRG